MLRKHYVGDLLCRLYIYIYIVSSGGRTRRLWKVSAPAGTLRELAIKLLSAVRRALQ